MERMTPELLESTAEGLDHARRTRHGDGFRRPAPERGGLGLYEASLGHRTKGWVEVFASRLKQALSKKGSLEDFNMRSRGNAGASGTGTFNGKSFSIYVTATSRYQRPGSPMVPISMEVGGKKMRGGSAKAAADAIATHVSESLDEARAPKPKFKHGDWVADKDGERPGRIDFVGDYDDHIGGYRYKVKALDGDRKYRNETNLKKIKKPANESALDERRTTGDYGRGARGRISDLGWKKTTSKSKDVAAQKYKKKAKRGERHSKKQHIAAQLRGESVESLAEDAFYLYSMLQKAKKGWTNLGVLTAGYRGRMTGANWKTAVDQLKAQGKAATRMQGGVLQLRMVEGLEESGARYTNQPFMFHVVDDDDGTMLRQGFDDYRDALKAMKQYVKKVNASKLQKAKGPHGYPAATPQELVGRIYVFDKRAKRVVADWDQRTGRITEK